MNQEIHRLNLSSNVVNGVPITIVRPTSAIEVIDAINILEMFGGLSPLCGEEIQTLVKPGLLREICDRDGKERLVHFVTTEGVYSLHYSRDSDIGKGAQMFTPNADHMLCAESDLLVYSHDGDTDDDDLEGSAPVH